MPESEPKMTIRTKPLRASICTRNRGHAGPCNGFPTEVCARIAELEQENSQNLALWDADVKDKEARISELGRENRAVRELVLPNDPEEDHAELMKELVAWDEHSIANIHNLSLTALLWDLLFLGVEMPERNEAGLKIREQIGRLSTALKMARAAIEEQRCAPNCKYMARIPFGEKARAEQNRSCNCWKSEALARINTALENK